MAKLDSCGRVLCSQCGRAMRMTVVTVDNERNGGKVAEFGCDNCGDALAMALNLDWMDRDDHGFRANLNPPRGS